MSTKLVKTENYLLLIDEEAEIKEGDIAIHDFGMGYKLEIPCDVDNLKSNTRHKVIAYRSLTKEAKELGLPLLPPFEVDVEELAYTKYPVSPQKRKVFLEGYKAAQPKQFSLEDMKKAFNAGGKRIYECEANGKDKKCYCRNDNDCNQRNYLTAEEYVQSLSTQQLPKEFIPEEYLSKEYVDEQDAYGYDIWKLKTITNSEGKEEIVGIYKY